MNEQLKYPLPAQFIDFSLYGGNRKSHAVYKWLCAQRSYQEAEEKIKRSAQRVSPLYDSLDFAQKVAYCFGHYYAEAERETWTHGASRKRDAAVAAYTSALQWSRKGFGPYADDDRQALEKLLSTAIHYVGGKHLSRGFRLKGGDDRPIGMLIRELTLHLEYFNLRRSLLTSIILDLLVIVDADGATERTVQRHITAVLSHDDR